VFGDTDYGDRITGVTFSIGGQLASVSSDGNVRLYDRAFKLVVPPMKMTGGKRPDKIAFSPDGASLAVGYADAPIVELLDGHSLTPLPGPDVEGLSGGDLSLITWSKDGGTLYASGGYWDGNQNPVLAWADAGHGARRTLPATRNPVAGLAALPDGGLFVATQDPFVELLAPDGRLRWVHPPPKANFRGQHDTLAVSTDGSIVDFGFEYQGKSPFRFDLRALKLSGDPPADQRTIPAKQAGVDARRWRSSSPTLDGKPIALEPYERSLSLAVNPDSSRFVLGTKWNLRAFDANGQLIWRRAAPTSVWAVNISGDGLLAIAAYGDGTIRWHRLDDGRELLALYVLVDKQNWVAWTPRAFMAPQRAPSVCCNGR
jgi:WD40 repeat protein